jgi:hypothetical protein
MPHPTKGYHTANGEKVPGTTTITGRFGDKSALIPWAWKRGRDFPDEPLYGSRDKAAELGTIVHNMVEASIRGNDPMEIADDLEKEIGLGQTTDYEQVMSAFSAFQEWFESNNFEILSQEEQFVSETHLYGGTPDAIAKDGKNRIVILDWKTSDGVYAEYLYQLAAYRILWNEVHPEQPLTGGSHLCRFAKKHGDFTHHFFPNLDREEEAFLLMRRLYEIDQDVKKRC